MQDVISERLVSASDIDASQWYVYGPILYWTALIFSVFFLTQDSLLSLIGVPFLVIIHHGAHEAVHGTLVPKKWYGSKRLNELSGMLGCALVGHNFLLMRWSHAFHHEFGRLEPEFTIEQSSRNVGWLGRVRYYLQLFGASALMHEVAGYFLPFFPEYSKYLEGGGTDNVFRSGKYLACQVVVFLLTIFFITSGGWYFLLVRSFFLVFWGVGQNVAHYGIFACPIKGMEIAARSYRVNKFMTFLLFGASFYHVEHHAFPTVPGLLLSNSQVLDAFKRAYGFEPNYKIGINSYLKDVWKQFNGPFPVELDEKWSKFD